ncbi:MAG: hypothetical protein M3297_09310 [Thermoproteota archaeon]|nr:hypothetical protein [Thermoproteota archaeon]
MCDRLFIFYYIAIPDRTLEAEAEIWVRLIRLNVVSLILVYSRIMEGNNDFERTCRLRGKNAIFDVHRGLAHSDENTINFKVSEIYSVPLEEAEEIHINYHLDRIVSALKDLARRRSLRDYELVSQLHPSEIEHSANEVSKGFLLERAAVDSLFNRICPGEKNMNFYG